MMKKTPTQIVVDRLIASGIQFGRVPSKTKVISHGQLRDNCLIHQTDTGQWDDDLQAMIPDRPHKFGRYIECSLDDSIRDLARSVIYVHSSTWMHGRYNWPELRISTKPITRSGTLLLTVEP